MGQVRLVTYQHEKDNRPAQITLELEELFTLLGEHVETDCQPCPGKNCPQKDGMAWSPGYIPPGKTRLGGNVEELGVAVFDLDHLTTDRLEAVLANLEGIDLLIHSSHSHRAATPETPADNCLRVIFALSRPITRKEWPAFWHSVVRKFDLPADPKAKDPSRIYFLPRRPAGNPYINIRGEGVPLDVDALLVQQHLAKPPAVQQLRAPPELGSTDLGFLRSFLRSYNPLDDISGEKREFIRRVLAGEMLADKPPNGTGRDDAVHRTATIIGWLMPLGTSAEAALELMRPSVAKIPEYADDGKDENFDGWMAKAAYSYGKSAAKKLEEASARNKLVELAHRRREPTRLPVDKVVEGTVVKSVETPVATPVIDKSVETPVEESVESPVGESVEADDPQEWRLTLKTRTLKSGEIVKDQMGVNISIILENHWAWRGALRFNEVTKDIECIGGPLPLTERGPDQLHTATENWLQRYEDLNLPTKVVESQILYVARKRSYDPLKDYLLGCNWDDKLRLDTWLEDYCGASTTSQTGGDISEYVRAVSARWMIAAVARALRPGCKVDNVMVLEGKQGKLKSTALNTLAGEFFSDALKDVHNKDSRMLAAQSWIIEIPELSAIQQAETEAMKSFFSQKADQFRVPYGRRVETFPRRCIFAGTTNAEDYFRDDTGNRRFWPIACVGTFDIEGLQRDRDQLWAEAVARFQAGEKWWFDEDANEYLEKITQPRLRNSAESELILDWWSRIEPSRRPEYLRLHEVAVDVLGIPKYDIDKRSTGVGRAIKKAGFSRVQRREGELRFWAYEPSAELVKMTRKKFERSRYLTLVASAEVKP